MGGGGGGGPRNGGGGVDTSLRTMTFFAAKQIYVMQFSLLWIEWLL